MIETMMFGTDEHVLVGEALAERHNEVASKLGFLRSWLDDRDFAAVVLAGVDTIAWLSGGLTSPVERGAAVGPLRVVVTPETVAVVTTNVERPRLEAEAGLAALG